MRRPVPPKKAERVARPAAEEPCKEPSFGTGASIRKFTLDQLDPRALIAVMTDVARGEAEFTNGDALRQNWESSKVQRVSHFFSSPPAGWCHCQCPDGSTLFLKFHSDEFQLLDESDNLAPTEIENNNDTMSDESKSTPAPKKKPAPPPKKTPGKAPAKAPVKPVAAPVDKKTAAIKPPKLPKTTGNYAWLLKRFQAQAVSQLTTANNRASVRDGLLKCETFTATHDFLVKAKVTETPAKFDAFCDVFFSATINR